ncbi:MAG: enoyl-CoA hydratase/isomerase family protein, partial [Acidimicrobiia bacterium]
TGAFEAVFNFEKPVVAAINGHAIAGGCVLAAACDRRLMAAGDGRIGVTELYAGVPFPVGALEIFRYTVGAARARDLILTGRACTPDEALAVELVDEVVPADELLKRAVTAAREMATLIPPETFRISKAQLHRETNERVARHRADNDPEVLASWCDPGVGPWARAFVERVRGRG